MEWKRARRAPIPSGHIELAIQRVRLALSGMLLRELAVTLGLTAALGLAHPLRGQTPRQPASPAPPPLPVAPASAPAAPSLVPEVGPVPTPMPVVTQMLAMASIKPADILYDLGCGDGRILVVAAKHYGIKAVGFDIDPERVRESTANAKTNGVAHLVTVKQADVFTVDLSAASIVTLYLLPELNVRLMPQLAKLRPGSRILSHDFDMRGAVPHRVHKLIAQPEWLERGPAILSQGPADAPPPLPLPPRTHTIYEWIVPWKKETSP